LIEGCFYRPVFDCQEIKTFRLSIALKFLMELDICLTNRKLINRKFGLQHRRAGMFIEKIFLPK
jgi:hypothetical protein